MDHISNELNKLRIDKSKRGMAKEPGSGKGRWFVIVAILLLAGAAGAYGIFGGSRTVEVDVIRPHLESASDSAVLVATGYVVPHHEIQVGSKIAGRVAWIGVEKGDRVQKDQLVVRLEDREYKAQYDQAVAAYESAKAHQAELDRGSRPEEIDRARSDVQRAEAQLRTDDANLKRVQSLVSSGVLPAQNLDDAKGRYDTSRATLDSLSRTYELTSKGPRSEQIDGARSETARALAAVDYAKSLLDATEIRVPSAGTILERNVEQGEMVTTSFVGDRGAKSFVVTLANLDDIQVELDINQNDFNRIGPQQACTVVTDAFPDRQYKCRVDEIAPEANRQKATVQVKVKFLEPDSYVKPEMNARVTFLAPESEKKSQSAEKLYVVPHGAVMDRDGGKAVFVIADGVIQIKPITIGKQVGNDEYVSAGLSGNESIVTGDAISRLKSGDRVEAKH